MENFFLIQTSDEEYFLLCFSFEGFISYINEIQGSKEIKHDAGLLVVDQLFATGDNDNRFIACKFDHGHIDLSTAYYVLDAEKFKALTSKILRKNQHLLKGTILTECQREMICEGQAV